MTDNPRDRTIRSFVLRTGRMTPGQERAYERHWSEWGLEHGTSALDIEAAFGREGERVLEIGFGMGDSLLAMAAAAPEKNFIGIEVHRPGVGRLFHNMAEAGVDNIRVYCHDAVEVLRDCIADGALDTVQIYFPDPWHKKRHHKRRLIQPAFVELLTARLKPQGQIHLATDWEDYAIQMMEVMAANPDLRNCFGAGKYAENGAGRPQTKFERRGRRLGHGIWDLVFELHRPQEAL